MNNSKDLDMLHGSLADKLLRFALPVAATGILEQLFNASDVAIVGNFGAGNRTMAVAAVGANSPIVGLILNFFIGIALGANVVIAHAMGSSDESSIHKAVHTSILMALFGGLFVMIIGELCMGPFLRFLDVPSHVLPYALLYMRIYLLGMPVILLYNFEAAIFRSVGQTKIPLQALCVSGCMNVVLNLFFVLVFHMSVDGVAIATVLSNALSALILFVKLVHSDQAIRFSRKDLSFDWNTFRKILRIGLPAGLQSGVFAFANIVIQSAVNGLGMMVMAASAAALNIEMFVYYLMNAFSQACTTFVGQNDGAGQKERCKRILRVCLLEDFLVTGTAIALVLIVGRFLLSFFAQDANVIDLGYLRLWIILLSYAFSMVYETISGYLRGFGISLVPALFTILGVCGVRLCWIFFVFPIHRKFMTILWAYPISLSTTALLMVILLYYFHPAKKEE